MSRIITFIIFTFLVITLSAQERMILRSNGEQIKLNSKKNMREAIQATKLIRSDGKEMKSHFVEPNLNIAGSLDTISYRPVSAGFNIDFGFTGQDIMMMWFEAPADLTIKGIGFTCSDDEGSANATVGMRIVKLNWTKEQLLNFTESTYMGYYPSTGDGFNESDYFGEEATDNWVSKNSDNPLPPWTNHENPSSNTFDYDLWQNGGFYGPMTAVASDVNNPIYNWLDLVSTGMGTVDIISGEIFGVVVTHDGTTLDGDRIGFWSDNAIGYPGWKYYENGRLSTDEPGWWVRMYTWDFAVVVDFTCTPPLLFYDVTILQTTQSTGPRTVEVSILDDNPSGETNIAEVNLLFSINGGDMVAVAMTRNGNTYSADIPGQQPGTVVTYSVEATDAEGNYTRWARDVAYNIFEVKNNNALLVFNGLDGATGYPQSYYFGTGDFTTYSTLEWNYDSWAFGKLTDELVNNYNNIIEITTRGPADINNDVIKSWLAEDGNRNYMLAGDEWLGAQTGWTNQAHEAGSFHYDVLGISFEYNDINYAGSGDQALASEVNAIEGSLLGGALFDLHQQISSDSGWTSPILYDPTYEVGVDNWLDGVEFLDDVEIDMTGIGIDSVTYNIAGHRTLDAGNKVVFLALEPLSLNSHNEAGDDEYYWYGFTQEAPQVQALSWFDAVVSVNKKDELPETFSLSQNYPNPFNPSTTIKYSIPNVETLRATSQNVTLKVYDVLGREVATLVNREQSAGNYEVKFDARNLTSGIYFYKLQSGGFVESRKMLLIK